MRAIRVASWILSFVLTLGAGIPLPAHAIIFVDTDASGTSNGTSWVNAYTDLVDAMNKNTTEEIWVADGMYDPDSDAADTFKIDNHPVYGGFNGTETNRSDRNPSANVTVLTGALSDGGNATRVIQKTFVLEAVLDGFTIKDGLGTSSTSDGAGLRVTRGTITIANCIFTNNVCGDQGGAASFIGIDVVDVIISNCVFNSNNNTNSNPDDGGAIFVGSGVDSLTVVECRFDGNMSDDDGGDIGIQSMTGPVIIRDSTFANSNAAREGAVLNRTSSGTNTIVNNTFTGHTTSGTAGVDGGVISISGTAPTSMHTIRNCTFADAVTAVTGEGGALYIDFGAVIIDGCTFTNINPSHADISGGAIMIEGGPSDLSAVSITSCIFDNVNAGSIGQGGAIKIGARGGIVTIIACTFTSCTAGDDGGAIFMADANSTYLRTLERCTFLDNTTTVNGDGGAVYIDEAAPGSRIVNCVFANNSAAGSGNGGGVWQSSGEMTYLHCTFYTNSADFGGGLYIRDIGIASVTNCIFRGNYAASGSTRNEFYASGGSITAIDYSNVNQAESSGLDVVGANMFNTDPLFENPANYDFRLKRESPLVDAGLTLGNVVFDRNGVARPQGSASDIGAFEVISDPDAMIFTIL